MSLIPGDLTAEFDWWLIRLAGFGCVVAGLAALGLFHRIRLACVARDSKKRAEDELRSTREFLDAVIESVPMTIVVKNVHDLTYALINRAGEAHFGLSRENVIGKTIYEILPKADADITTARDNEFIAANRELFVNSTPIATANGLRVMSSLRVPIKDKDGELRYILGILEDITDRERQQDELRRTRAFLDTIIENVPAILTVKETREQRYTLVNRAAENFFGMSRAEMIGKRARELFAPKAVEFVEVLDREAIQSGKPEIFDEHSVETPRNGTRLIATKKVLVRNGEGEAQFLLSLSEDVTERRHAEEKIAHLARHDPLTDLPNRIAFHDALSSALECASRSGGSFGLLSIDLDSFKEINDLFGHAAGDAFLCVIARRMKAAAIGAFLARVGGDEFALIVTGGAQPAAAETAAEALLKALAGTVEIAGQHLRTAMSIGVAVYPSDGKDTNTLLANADAALHRAKAEARGSLRFFEAKMDERLRERRTLQNELHVAIENGDLVLYYQPQARIDGEIIGFEALVRWIHPVRGMIGPDIFIPLAEENGLIVAMGEWILREACREAASWPLPLQIAVNLSPVQFHRGDLPALAHAILLQSGLAPNRLELEITEGVLIGDFQRAISILRRLKAFGVRIAMDDFGTGYSSLSYLQAFPFDKIKIDRSFIVNLVSNQNSAAIVRAVIGLSHGLHLPVTAEGVETAEQLAMLARKGCDEVQGFLIGRPEPIEHYAKMVGRAPVQKLKLVAG